MAMIVNREPETSVLGRDHRTVGNAHKEERWRVVVSRVPPSSWTFITDYELHTEHVSNMLPIPPRLPHRRRPECAVLHCVL